MALYITKSPLLPTNVVSWIDCILREQSSLPPSPPPPFLDSMALVVHLTLLPLAFCQVLPAYYWLQFKRKTWQEDTHRLFSGALLLRSTNVVTIYWSFRQPIWLRRRTSPTRGHEMLVLITRWSELIGISIETWYKSALRLSVVKRSNQSTQNSNERPQRAYQNSKSKNKLTFWSAGKRNRF